MGMKVAAVSLMCQDPRVFQAMEMAGTPCPYEGKIGKEAEKSWKENKQRHYSIASKQKYSIIKIAKLFFELLGSVIPIFFLYIFPNH